MVSGNDGNDAYPPRLLIQISQASGGIEKENPTCTRLIEVFTEVPERPLIFSLLTFERACKSSPCRPAAPFPKAQPSTRIHLSSTDLEPAPQSVAARWAAYR